MKKLLLIVLALAVVGGIAGYLLWNKPHQDIQSAKADLTVDAAAIFTEFNTDEAAANEKYMNKIVAVAGTVTESKKDEQGNPYVMLGAGADAMGGVKCNLDPLAKHKRTEFQPGDKVTFKGTCSGLLMDVVMDRCSEQ